MTDAPDRPLELLAMAATTAAWTAVPDYVSGRTGQRLARAGVAAASAAVLWATRESRRPAWEHASDDTGAHLGDAATAVGPATVAASVLALPAAVVGGKRLEEWAVAALERRGVRRPRTVVGLAWGVASVARPATVLLRGRAGR